MVRNAQDKCYHVHPPLGVLVLPQQTFFCKLNSVLTVALLPPVVEYISNTGRLQSSFPDIPLLELFDDDDDP